MWQTAFADKLRIRFSTHHKKCNTCLRHRLILKKLGNCGPARRAQQRLLDAHLSRQYQDRQIYWAARAQSRVQSVYPKPLTICAVIDGMDSAKHSWPRSWKMASKEFAGLIRPKLTHTAIIWHGHGVTINLSPHYLSTNSSRSCELVANGMSTLGRSLDMSCIHLHLQSDNCSKETKNNGMIRMVGTWVGLGKLQSAELDYLQSGHSHEDVDCMFSQLRTWIEGNPELETPEKFQTCLQEFFRDSTRPHEKSRTVQMVTRFRDWPLEFQSTILAFVQRSCFRRSCS